MLHQKWKENYQEKDPDQIRKDIEMREENWEEIQENSKWENRDGWRYLCNSLPISLETRMMMITYNARKRHH